MWVQLNREKRWHFADHPLVGTRQREVLCGVRGEETSVCSGRPDNLASRRCPECWDVLEALTEHVLYPNGRGG